MLPLIYTDTDGRDIGRKLTYTADMEIGADTANTFELKVNLDDRLPVGGGSFIYRESSEFGGIVDAIGTETMTSPAKAIYRGRTWTGVLAKRVLEPPAGLSHLTYKGEANAGIAWIIGLLSLGDLFIVRPEHSGFAIDYQFYRYIDAYSGICMMLTSVGAKLKLAWNGDKIELWCEPVMDYTQTREIDSDRLRFTVEKVLRPVNSLVCLGKGDLEERTVMHFYANADREVVDGGGNPLPQSLFGADCVEEVYDYSNAEDPELREEGLKKIKELQNIDTCDVDLVNDHEYDIGDLVGVREKRTGIVISAPVTSKTYVVNAHGAKITYAVGKSGVSTSGGAIGSGSGGGGIAPSVIDEINRKIAEIYDLIDNANYANKTGWAANRWMHTDGSGNLVAAGDPGTTPRILGTSAAGTITYLGSPLPVANGGSGLTASPSELVNLASTAAANVFQASPRPGVTGVLPLANSGLGAALSNLYSAGNRVKQGSAAANNTGWTQLGNILICWGAVDVACTTINTWASTSVTFPVPYSNLPLVLACPYLGLSGTATLLTGAYASSTTNCSVYMKRTDSTGTYRVGWFAIGHCLTAY